MKNQEKIYCRCGCGTLMKKYDNRNRERFYVNGHRLKGNHLSEETKEKIRNSNYHKNMPRGKDHFNFGENNPAKRPEVRQKLIKNHRTKHGYEIWCKGLTKEDDIRLKKSGEQISLSKKGKLNPKSSETKKRLFAEGKLKPWNKGIKMWKNKVQPRLGKHNSQESKLKISNNKERAKKISIALKGRVFSEETKKRMSLNSYIKTNPDKHPKGMLGKKHSEQAKLKMSLKRIGKKFSIEHNLKVGLSHKKLWQNPDYKEKQIKRLLEGLSKSKPSSYEKKIMDLINKHNLPYKYVGDGKFWIGYKNPDFINCNGEKIAIEVYSDYFKEKEYGSINDYEKQRSEHFAKYGWKTIFIRKPELNNERLILNKILGGKK